MHFFLKIKKKVYKPRYFAHNFLLTLYFDLEKKLQNFSILKYNYCICKLNKFFFRLKKTIINKIFPYWVYIYITNLVEC